MPTYLVVYKHVYIHVRYFRQKIQNSLMQYVHVYRSHKEMMEITQTDVGVSTKPTTMIIFPTSSPAVLAQYKQRLHTACTCAMDTRTAISMCKPHTDIVAATETGMSLHTQYCYCWRHHSKGYNVHTYCMYEMGRFNPKPEAPS